MEDTNSSVAGSFCHPERTPADLKPRPPVPIVGRSTPQKASRQPVYVAGPPQENTERSPFQVSDEGVFFLREAADGTMEPIRLAARVDVIGKTRDSAGNAWGRLLTWKDDEGRLHEWAMPMEALASDSAGVRARLLSEGLPFITTNARYRERFTEFLQTATATKLIRCTGAVGWIGETYVMPDQSVGPPGCEQVLFQNPDEAIHYWRCSGTTEQWREHVGMKCGGNSRLIIAAACGFAGPVLSLVGAESGGVHFHGATSIGKSTALFVGGSVCGGGGTSGFAQTWRTTINGLEAIAAAHNDGTLFLDELAQVEPSDAAETAYLLGNGQGKLRMTRSIGARRKLTWTLLYVSTGELTLAEHAASAGKATRGGAEVRLLNIDADAGVSLGIFEDLHGFPSADLFALALKEASRQYYGAPFRSFVAKLAENRTDVGKRVRATRDTFASCVPPGATGEVRRAAERFALIGAAGELATEYDLTGWCRGESIAAAERCFREWAQQRGTVGPSDLDAGVRQVRAFLEAHGTSRFQPIRCSSNGSGGSLREQQATVRDRAGFRRQNADTGELEYLIFPEAFRKEVCSGFSHRAVLKELERRSFLLRTPPDMTIKPRLPDLGTVRVYCVRATILAAD
jgi:putative DNA primase/helicase